jgi:hypothetical protein
MKKDSSKKILFERMNSVAGMPLKEHYGDAYDEVEIAGEKLGNELINLVKTYTEQHYLQVQNITDAIKKLINDPYIQESLPNDLNYLKK